MPTKQDIKLAQNFINYCKSQFAKYSSDMDTKQKEIMAYWIFDKLLFDSLCQKFEKELPIINNIDALAGDLEWSNAIDIDEDWEKLIVAINEFEKQLSEKFPQNN